MWDKDYLSLINNLYNKNEKITIDSQQLTKQGKESYINEELYRKLILNEILISNDIQHKIYDFGERIVKLESELSHMKENIKENRETKRFSLSTKIAILSLIFSLLLTINTFYPLSDKLFNIFSEKIETNIKK